jgi:hypothetical protein
MSDKPFVAEAYEIGVRQKLANLADPPDGEPDFEPDGPPSVFCVHFNVCFYSRERRILKRVFSILLFLLLLLVHESKNAFRLLKGIQCEMLKGDTV